METKTLSCPFCDIGNVHIEAAKVNRDGEVTEVRDTGTKLHLGETNGRGASITVTFWCENGHKWNRHTKFHKGSVTETDEILVAGDPAWSNFVTDLWRD